MQQTRPTSSMRPSRPAAVASPSQSGCSPRVGSARAARPNRFASHYSGAGYNWNEVARPESAGAILPQFCLCGLSSAAAQQRDPAYEQPARSTVTEPIAPNRHFPCARSSLCVQHVPCQAESPVSSFLRPLEPGERFGSTAARPIARRWLTARASPPHAPSKTRSQRRRREGTARRRRPPRLASPARAARAAP